MSYPYTKIDVSADNAVPVIAFSDEADFDSLNSVLRHLKDFVWQVELKSGGFETGEVTPLHDDTVSVRRMDDNGNWQETVIVALSDIVRFVYL